MSNLGLHGRLVLSKARNFLLVDLWEIFFRFLVKGKKKKEKKALKMTGQGEEEKRKKKL